MKNKKDLKRNQQSRIKDPAGDSLQLGKVRKIKEKYKHKNHWLREEDDDYELPKFKDEEE